MEEYDKLQKEIIATLERLEKSGALDKFMESIPKWILSYTDYTPIITPSCGYKEVSSSTKIMAATFIHDAENKLALAQAYIAYPRELYDSYNNEYREYIQNEDILKYLADYEADCGEGNAWVI